MSTTFTLFSCRNVCEKTLFRLDLEEECWVGRHAAYSYAVGVPMLVIYVFGLPLLAMTMIQRLQKKMRALTANSVILKESTKRSSGRGHHRWFSNVNVVNKGQQHNKGVRRRCDCVGPFFGAVFDVKKLMFLMQGGVGCCFL